VFVSLSTYFFCMILRFKSFRGSELKWTIFIRKRKDIIKLHPMKIHGRMNSRLYLLSTQPVWQNAVVVYRNFGGINVTGKLGSPGKLT
jgi:hypothetical protein